MSKKVDFRFSKNANNFIKFIMDLFINSSDDISEILVCNVDRIIFKSEWKDVDVVVELIKRWQNQDLPPTFTLQNIKFIKLHVSPYNLIFRSIKEQKGLVGIKFQVESEWVQIFAIIAQKSNMQVFLTAMKEIFLSIVELGENMSNIVEIDANSLQLHLSLLENKKVISTIIEELKNIQFECNYTDRGDSIILHFKYEKKEEVRYPDYMYK